eukprot:972683-Rhodomonas_salina.1
MPLIASPQLPGLVDEPSPFSAQNSTTLGGQLILGTHPFHLVVGLDMVAGLNEVLEHKGLARLTRRETPPEGLDL